MLSTTLASLEHWELLERVLAICLDHVCGPQVNTGVPNQSVDGLSLYLSHSHCVCACVCVFGENLSLFPGSQVGFPEDAVLRRAIALEMLGRREEAELAFHQAREAKVMHTHSLTLASTHITHPADARAHVNTTSMAG